PPALPSFPTRRSSDLVLHLQPGAVDDRVALAVAPLVVLDDQRTVAVHDDHLAATALGFVMGLDDLQTLVVHGPGVLGIEHVLLRSEEHTSELQSRGHL